VISIHPNILEKEGKKEFVVLSYEEFFKVQEELEDYESLKSLRRAKAEEGNAMTTSFHDAKRMFGIE